MAIYHKNLTGADLHEPKSHTHDDRYYTETESDTLFLTDALSDGSIYGRKNGAWEVVNVDLSGYVPYTGATGNVDLGNFGLTANSLTIDAAGSATLTLGNAGGVADISQILFDKGGVSYWNFHLEANGNFCFLDSFSNKCKLEFADGANGNIFIAHEDTAKVGIGNILPSEKLDVTGNVKASGIIDSGLTITRIPFASTAGLLTDNANLTWDGVSVNIVGTTGASPTPVLKLGSYYDSGGAVSISHINLYGNTYGFGVAASTLVYVSDRYHKFYDNTDLTTATVTLDALGGDISCVGDITAGDTITADNAVLVSDNNGISTLHISGTNPYADRLRDYIQIAGTGNAGILIGTDETTGSYAAIRFGDTNNELGVFYVAGKNVVVDPAVLVFRSSYNNASAGIKFDTRTGGGAGTFKKRMFIANNGDVTFGSGEAGVDLVINFDGETNNGILTWMEDENYFTTNTPVRGATSLYRRYYHIDLEAANPGASGALWVEASANTTGGWRLTNAAWLLRGQADVHSDWDGATDMTVSINFMVNINNTAGGVGDTVDLRLNAYYKGLTDVAAKTQAVEVATVVGQSAQYKQFKATFTLNWDETSNVIEVGDVIAFVLNLETDTSEVDDIVVTSMEFYYQTTHSSIESGDI